MSQAASNFLSRDITLGKSRMVAISHRPAVEQTLNQHKDYKSVNCPNKHHTCQNFKDLELPRSYGSIESLNH